MYDGPWRRRGYDGGQEGPERTDRDGQPRVGDGAFALRKDGDSDVVADLRRELDVAPNLLGHVEARKVRRREHTIDVVHAGGHDYVIRTELTAVLDRPNLAWTVGRAHSIANFGRRRIGLDAIEVHPVLVGDGHRHLHSVGVDHKVGLAPLLLRVQAADDGLVAVGRSDALPLDKGVDSHLRPMNVGAVRPDGPCSRFQLDEGASRVARVVAMSGWRRREWRRRRWRYVASLNSGDQIVVGIIDEEAVDAVELQLATILQHRQGHVVAVDLVREENRQPPDGVELCDGARAWRRNVRATDLEAAVDNRPIGIPRERLLCGHRDACEAGCAAVLLAADGNVVPVRLRVEEGRRSIDALAGRDGAALCVAVVADTIGDARAAVGEPAVVAAARDLKHRRRGPRGGPCVEHCARFFGDAHVAGDPPKCSIRLDGEAATVEKKVACARRLHERDVAPGRLVDKL